MKLSRMLGTSVNYWLNLQKTYDSLIANFQSDEELVHERSVFEYIDYSYFRIHFGLPDFMKLVISFMGIMELPLHMRQKTKKMLLICMHKTL